MFIQKKLAIGVAAGVLVATGIFTAVQAVHVNSDGTGQVLLFPYFNALPGYITNINLVNSTEQTKAVKVRFRDGKSSRDILNFNIYMSPFDVWTGTIKGDKDGYGSFSTIDRTCAMPLTMAADCTDPNRCQVMKPFDKADVVNSDTAEGYVEIIEMGEVADKALQDAAKHNGGRPNNCQAIEDAWNKTGKFVSGTGGTTGLTPPTGGLFGSSAVLNLLEGNAFAVNPVAIDNYSTQAQHYRPDSLADYLLPSLASGNVAQSNVMVQKTNGQSDMVVTNWKPLAQDPCVATEGAPCGVNPYPMAHVLATSYIMNEYFVDPTDGYDGHTDWVVTFPMKKHGIHNGAADVVAKFDGLYDREEDRAGSLGTEQDKYFGFSTTTGMSPQTTLTREVNVLNFVSTDPSYNLNRTVFLSPATQLVNAGPFVHGWGRLAFPSYNLAAGFDSAVGYGATPMTYNRDNAIYNGVPTLGFAAIEGNVSANPHARFGNAVPHKTRRY